MFSRLKAFRRNRGITGVYFGKSLRRVPTGSIVLFPCEPTTLNCGITGLLAFKKASGKGKVAAPAIEELEARIERVAQHTLAKSDIQEASRSSSYLAGATCLETLKRLCEGLKSRDPFCEVILDADYQRRLAAVWTTLDHLIAGEAKAITQARERLAPATVKQLSTTLEHLRDIAWCLHHEILANVKGIAALGSFDSQDKSPLAVARLQELNLVFNNLDRLEVRGRDSAGISMLFDLEKPTFSEFMERLTAQGLRDALDARQGTPVLTNRCIRINDRGEAVSVSFTYKVAVEVGGLGDNVRFLKQEVAADTILQAAIRLPTRSYSVVAHTRWASVGEISEANCHPVDNVCEPSGGRSTGETSAIHEQQERQGIIHVCLNGDIDNYPQLKTDFERITGQTTPVDITTDTKIIPLEIQRHLRDSGDLEEAFRRAVSTFEGSHAISMHSDFAPGRLFLAQKGSGQAIFVGLAEEYFVPASEIYGFVEQTPRYLKLDGEKRVEGISGQTQGQIFVLDARSGGRVEAIKAMYYDGTPITLTQDDVRETHITSRDIDRQHYPHYFLKEISESPRSVEQTLEGRLTIVEADGRRIPQIALDASVIPTRLASALRQKTITKIFFIGQGTAGVAAAGCAELLASYLKDTGLLVASLKASEYSGFMLDSAAADTLVIAITQSGTTTDTNRAIDMARARGAYTLAIVNRRDSDITFKVDGVLYTSTGRDIEMSVASTKAYYSQITAGSLLGLKLAQLMGTLTDEGIVTEIEHLWRLPASMKQVLDKQEEIRRSAESLAVTKQYWAVVGSGPNKTAADEIRIKLSELCYKTISSDVVEDKKHIDLSSEPLIFVCAAGNRDDVVSDVVKDTAIFKAHEAIPVVVATEGERRFDPYADAVIHVPEVKEHFASILNTLAGHLWGYYAALAIHEESQYLFTFREQIRQHVSDAIDRGMDVYEIVLDERFREQAARFYQTTFKERLRRNRYATALAAQEASDLTLLLKYLAGKLPVSDFEVDFGMKGTAPNMLRGFFECMGRMINEMTRPIDAIKHQAKTVTVGTSRIAERAEGLFFDAIKRQGFDKSHLTTTNVLVLRRLQEVVAQINGLTIYRISDLNYLGEPVEDSTIFLVKKEGSAATLTSRTESDNRLVGTKQIIVKNGNVFIGRGQRDNRSILAVPLTSSGTRIDHLVLFHVSFKDQVDLPDKVHALGGKYQHIRNLVAESSLLWKDEYLELLKIEDLFGMSAEKIAERMLSRLNSQYAE